MSQILKIEAFAGMSGDMFLSALCGLADAYEEITRLPALLHLESEVRIRISDMSKTGIACKHVKVVDLEKDPPEGVPFRVARQEEHSAVLHKGLKPAHPHRHLSDILAIIERAELPGGAKERAKTIFYKLGRAEAGVHGIELEKVHFHEVGAIDSIVDIVGSAWLIDRLDIAKTYCTKVTTGFGFARTEHGKLPIPCPATQALLQGFPTVAGDQQGEMTTPTGAAILASLEPDFDIPALRELKTSYGPGEKDFTIPNTLRLSLCAPATREAEIIVIQTNIDDETGEYLGQEFQDELFEHGALDLFIQQVIMKRGRPGQVLNVLCRRADFQRISSLILERSSTIGLRYYPVQRLELHREILSFESSYGTVGLKRVQTPSGQVRVKVESRDIMRLSKSHGESPVKIHHQILAEYRVHST